MTPVAYEPVLACWAVATPVWPATFAGGSRAYAGAGTRGDAHQARRGVRGGAGGRARTHGIARGCARSHLGGPIPDAPPFMLKISRISRKSRETLRDLDPPPYCSFYVVGVPPTPCTQLFHKIFDPPQIMKIHRKRPAGPCALSRAWSEPPGVLFVAQTAGMLSQIE